MMFVPKTQLQRVLKTVFMTVVVWSATNSSLDIHSA